MSLADRLKKMAIKPSASCSTGATAKAAAARPSRQAARSAAAHFSVAVSDCDDEEGPASDDNYSSDPDEVMSPAPAVAKAKSRHPVGGKQVLESEDEEAPAASMDTYEAPTPSPAVARQKARKVGGSPLPVPLALARKAAAKPKAAPKAKFAAGDSRKNGATMVVLDSDSDAAADDVELQPQQQAVVPAADGPSAGSRGQRARRAPAKTYVEISDDDEDAAAVDSDVADDEGDSDFVESD
eukprot:gene6915-7131_t